MKKIVINGWIYEYDQNQETGDLKITIHSNINPKSLLEKAASYIKSEASLITHSISLEQIESRKQACSNCDSCDKKSDDTWYCKSCGCPQWERSKLQNKWRMPAATCSLNKWERLESSNASP